MPGQEFSNNRIIHLRIFSGTKREHVVLYGSIRYGCLDPEALTQSEEKTAIIRSISGKTVKREGETLFEQRNLETRKKKQIIQVEKK